MQVGAQTSRGIEASLNWAFAPRWSLDANATVLKAEFEEFLETTGSPPMLVSRDGNVPPNVAERLASAWLSWQFAPEWSAAGGVRYVGKRYADNANTLELPGYSTTDLALTWQAAPRTRLSARLFNVFDKAYYATAVLHQHPVAAGGGPARRIHRRPSLLRALAMSLRSTAKRWTYLVHRWLGIGGCLLMLLWFVSGMVMLFIGYPKLTPGERLAALPVLGEARDLQGCLYCRLLCRPSRRPWR